MLVKGIPDQIGKYLLSITDIIADSKATRIISGRNVENNEKVAVKIIDRRKTGIVQTAVEIEILKSRTSRHNFVRLLDVFQKRFYIILVLEYVESDLYDYLLHCRCQSEKDILSIFTQLVHAVAHLHRQSIVHLDLKPENVLIDSKTKKIFLTDFGHSKILFNRDEKIKGMRGSPGFVAPEILTDPSKPYDGFKADIFSMGVILYCLLFGEYPFDSNMMCDRSSLRFPDSQRCSESLRNLLCTMLSEDPEQRPSAESILQSLWISDQMVPLSSEEKKCATPTNFGLNNP